MPKNKKLVTADDYRHDRDYWKRRALKQQNVINTLRTHKNRLTNDRNAKEHALEYMRQALREICPHDKLNTERFTDKLFCERCNDFVREDEIN